TWERSGPGDEAHLQAARALLRLARVLAPELRVEPPLMPEGIDLTRANGSASVLLRNLPSDLGSCVLNAGGFGAHGVQVIAVAEEHRLSVQGHSHLAERLLNK